MGLVSPTTVSNGAPRVPADINTPIGQLAAVINGQIDNTNVATGAAIDFAKVAGGSATALGAWQAWTPTWANLTVGNGTVVAFYQQIGKTVNCVIGFTLGSTSAVSTGPTFTLPVTAAARYGTTTTSLGQLYLEDSGVAGYMGMISSVGSTTVASLTVSNAGGTYLTNTGITSTVPLTWGTADYFKGSFFYEAA